MSRDLPPCPLVAGHDPTWTPRDGYVPIAARIADAKRAAFYREPAPRRDAATC